MSLENRTNQRIHQCGPSDPGFSRTLCLLRCAALKIRFMPKSSKSQRDTPAYLNLDTWWEVWESEVSLPGAAVIIVLPPSRARRCVSLTWFPRTSALGWPLRVTYLTSSTLRLYWSQTNTEYAKSVLKASPTQYASRSWTGYLPLELLPTGPECSSDAPFFTWFLIFPVPASP